MASSQPRVCDLRRDCVCLHQIKGKVPLPEAANAIKLGLKRQYLPQEKELVFILFALFEFLYGLKIHEIKSKYNLT